jgi:hypothetical protein
MLCGPAPPPGSDPTVRHPLSFVVMLTLATAAGLGVTAWAVRGLPVTGGATFGAWTTWPSLGTSGVDPYGRAVLAVSGRIPLARADGLAFVATTTDDGTALNGFCTVVVEGPVPVARAWTLSLLDAAGLPAANPAGRHVLTSQEAVAVAGGVLRITVSPRPHPGNWLPSGGLPAYRLVLSVYEPSGSTLEPGLMRPALPDIRQQDCL